MRVQGDGSQYQEQNQHDLLVCFEDLLNKLEDCFEQKRTFERAKALAVGLLCSEAPHTLTNWITALGRQDLDWSGDYRFFSRDIWESGDIFDVILEKLGEHLEWSEDFFAAIDEVHLPKCGRKIDEVRTLRDPLALPFCRGLHRALRFINCCGMLSSTDDWKNSTRAICIDFELAPPAKKPSRKAGDEERAAYKAASKECAISRRGSDVIARLRRRMDADPGLKDKRLVVSVDGGFTNKQVFGQVPQETVVVGRIRKDACLYSLPPPYPGRGRRRKYGDRLPTPEEIRKDPSVPWKEGEFWAAGKLHRTRYKEVGPLLWRIGAQDHPVKLLIIEPLSYRLSRKSKLLYKEPAYLVVSDVEYPVESGLQCYFHRWQIEVSHRESKSIVGVGDGQVRNSASVRRLPQFVMAVYSAILLAAHEAYGAERTGEYGPPARWRNDRRIRASCQDILRLFRRKIQHSGIESFSGFATRTNVQQTPHKYNREGIKISETAGIYAREPFT
jgi:hypothetical protein